MAPWDKDEREAIYEATLLYSRFERTRLSDSHAPFRTPTSILLYPSLLLRPSSRRHSVFLHTHTHTHTDTNTASRSCLLPSEQYFSVGLAWEQITLCLHPEPQPRSSDTYTPTSSLLGEHPCVKMSPGAIMPDSPKSVSHSKPAVNGQTNGLTNGHADGHANGKSSGAHINCHSAPEVKQRPRIYSQRQSSSHLIEPYGTYQSSPGGPQGRSNAKIRSYSEDVKCKTFPRLSKPVELLRHSYDCVVIGSGYGGGVAAARMARAGESVCLLERGKERWPGEYPSETTDALEQVHYSGEFAPGWLPSRLVNGGDPTGMYHLIFGRGQNAVVCNGQYPASTLDASPEFVFPN